MTEENSEERQGLSLQLRDLRNQVVKQCNEAKGERIRNNPQMTLEEVRLDCFLEELEPQVLEAVRKMTEKGYSTKSSGFAGDNDGTANSNLQMIDGQFKLDNVTIEKLREMNVDIKALGSFTTIISFHPENADLNEITEKWNAIADVLPNLGHPAYKASHFENQQFSTQEQRDYLTLEFGMAEGWHLQFPEMYLQERDHYLELAREFSQTPHFSEMDRIAEGDMNVDFIDPSGRPDFESARAWSLYYASKDENTRMQNGPEMDEVEQKMGIVREGLEYQVRDAVYLLNKKGYNTTSSGFWGDRSLQTLQFSAGQLGFSEEITSKLEEMGVKVEDGKGIYNCSLSFSFNKANLGEIKTIFDKIATLLPTK
jgi:hypothetical protein